MEHLKGTRLPADALVENVEAFMEMDGLTVDEAIAETLNCFPGTPGGAATIRAFTKVECATFVPKKFRKPGSSPA
jgi:hypothetical protein